MLIEKIGEGVTIEQARENARKALNAPESADVKFEIICAPQKKILGLFGGKNAVIKASYEVKDKKERKKPSKKQASGKKSSLKVKEEVKPEKEKKRQPLSPERLEKAKDEALVYAKQLIEKVSGQQAEVSAQIIDEGIFITVECEDHGIIIGRRGETLDAIQYLTSLVVNKGKDDYVRVSLDIGNYREKREQTLIALAQKTAKQVLKSGRRISLEPMNPYERHIIHTAVQNIEHIKTHSVGSNIDRRVVILPEEEYEKKREHGRNDRGRKPAREKYVPQAEPREIRKDVEDAPMYGVITKKED